MNSSFMKDRFRNLFFFQDDPMVPLTIDQMRRRVQQATAHRHNTPTNAASRRNQQSGNLTSRSETIRSTELDTDTA